MNFQKPAIAFFIVGVKLYRETGPHFPMLHRTSSGRYIHVWMAGNKEAYKSLQQAAMHK